MDRRNSSVLTHSFHVILKKTLFSYGAGCLLKNGNPRRLEQEPRVRKLERFWHHSYRELPRRNTQLDANRTISGLKLFSYKPWNKMLWETEPSSMYIWCVTAVLFGCCSGDQYTVEQDCHSLRGVIRVIHDSAILPEHHVVHRLLAVTQSPCSCLSRVKAEIHFLLIKVREPVCMQTLVLQSSGDLNRLDQMILEAPANLVFHG